MFSVLSVIAPLFIIIFGTALLQKYKNIGDHWSEVLNEYALKIGLPVLVFASLSKVPFSLSEQADVLISNSVFILGSLVLAIITGKILRLNKSMFRTLFICFAFGSIAYMGIPVLQQVYGEAIIPSATLIVGIYLFWVFTIEIGYLDYSKSRKKSHIFLKILKNLIFNPLLLSVVLGLIVGSLRVELPEVLLKAMDMITVSVSPIVLIVIGLFIGKSQIGELKEWWPVFCFTVLTLMILPTLFYFGVRLFGYSPSAFSVSIIQAAMPLAITPFALADQYGLNKLFIARSIVLSTIFSVITLPFWIWILES